MTSINPSAAVNKLTEILKIATIDIECVGCKEVYPNFMNQLISRISSSVNTFYKNNKSNESIQQEYQEKNGQLIGVSWNNVKEMDLISTAKPRRGRLEIMNKENQFNVYSATKGNDHHMSRMRTPRTERFQYNMAKMNEIDLAVEKKSQMKSGRKDIFRTPHGEIGKNVRLNELSSGGKFVFGRSGSKWDKGENFKDVVGLDFYEGSESKYIF